MTHVFRGNHLVQALWQTGATNCLCIGQMYYQAWWYECKQIYAILKCSLLFKYLQQRSEFIGIMCTTENYLWKFRTNQVQLRALGRKITVTMLQCSWSLWYYKLWSALEILHFNQKNDPPGSFILLIMSLGINVSGKYHPLKTLCSMLWFA